MIVTETFLNKARSAFDLNEYEVKTWTALLSRNESTAGELAEISTVPRSRVYDILESLTEKGFVIKKKGSPIKYKTVTPEEALAAAKNNALGNADKESKEFEKVKKSASYKELEKLYGEGSVALEKDVSGLIKGRRNINAQLLSLVSKAKKSLTICTTKDGVIRKAETLGKELKKAKTRGVSVNLAAPLDSLDELPTALKKIANVKKNHGRDARFVVVDNEHVLFILNDDKEVHENYDCGVWVNSPFLANGFDHFFNNSWKGMKKL